MQHAWRRGWCRAANHGGRMTDNTELQRLARLRRLGRQIAASLPTDLDLQQAFQVHGHVRELPAGGAREMKTPTSRKAVLRAAVLRAEVEAAMANYRGQVTLCPTGRPAGV